MTHVLHLIDKAFQRDYSTTERTFKKYNILPRLEILNMSSELPHIWQNDLMKGIEDVEQKMMLLVNVYRKIQESSRIM